MSEIMYKCASRRFRIVWQCGHCGTVYNKANKKQDAINCCDGNEEKGYECSTCLSLYHNKPKYCTRYNTVFFKKVEA